MNTKITQCSFFICELYRNTDLIRIMAEIKLTYQAEISEILRKIFEYKQETLVNQKISEMIKTKTQTTRRQNWNLSLEIKICRFWAGMTKFGDYSIGIAQFNDKIEQKLKVRFSLGLLSAYWPAALTCLTCAVFPLVASKISKMLFQSHVAHMKKSFTQSLAYRQQLTLLISLLFFFYFFSLLFLNFKLSSSLRSSHSSNFSKVNFWPTRETLFIENILSRIMT